jgi:hypothetical protein
MCRCLVVPPLYSAHSDDTKKKDYIHRKGQTWRIRVNDQKWATGERTRGEHGAVAKIS